MIRRPTDRRSKAPRAHSAPRVLVALALAAMLGGCFALDPRLPSQPPPPNLPQGVVLLDLTDDEAALLERPEVVRVHESHFEELAASDPEMAAQVLAHRIATGMRIREVLWSMTGHPVRIRQLGPPGGRILLFMPGRWFVRLGSEGTVIDAGRY